MKTLNVIELTQGELEYIEGGIYIEPIPDYNGGGKVYKEPTPKGTCI